MSAYGDMMGEIAGEDPVARRARAVGDELRAVAGDVEAIAYWLNKIGGYVTTDELTYKSNLPSARVRRALFVLEEHGLARAHSWTTTADD